MPFNSTLSAILRGRWLIDKTFADSQKPMVIQFLNGNSVSFTGTSKSNIDAEKSPNVIGQIGHSCTARSVYDIRPGHRVANLQEGSIALVTLAGPLLKYGDECSDGMVDHQRLINQLAAASNIHGIIVNIDSPGGQVDGTSSLAQAIKEAGDLKPVIAIIDDGMAASAALWVASAAQEIYATQQTDMFGSVGVYTTIGDWDAHYRDYFKLNVRDIYAPQSNEKNLGSIEALKGNDTVLQEELSVLADQFINTISTNRKGKIKGDSWKTGKMFFAPEAASLGLIDGIKSFSQVLDRMQEILTKSSSSTKKNNMAFEKTLAVAKATAFTVNDEGFQLQEEHLNNIEAALATSIENATALETAQANAADLAANLVTANDQLTTANATIETLRGEIAVLGKKPSGTGTPLITTKDENSEEKPVPSYLDPNSAINKLADRATRKK